MINFFLLGNFKFDDPCMSDLNLTYKRILVLFFFVCIIRF